MIILVLTACPTALRGQLTRWLLEVTPGVFVGHANARMRDKLWDMVVENIGRGRALMVQPARNEQRLSFRTFGHEWQPRDFDGVTLMTRPLATREKGVTFLGSSPRPPENWSVAARRRRFGRMSRDPGLK